MTSGGLSDDIEERLDRITSYNVCYTKLLRVLIRGGTVVDGTGGPPRPADVGIRGDRVAAVGDLSAAVAPTVVDATGLAVAPSYNFV